MWRGIRPLRCPDRGLCTIHSPYYLYYSFGHSSVEKGNAVKFRCEREALAEALTTAGRATSGRSASLPVLSGLRLELVGDQLTVTGTDLDLTIQIAVEVGGDRDGDDVSISNGRSQFTVRPLSFDDYPKLAAPVTSSVTLPSAEFGEALRQVTRAASTDEARQILTGVLMVAEGDGLRMVATDSYRLAVRDLTGHQVLAADQKVIVPGRALTELQRLVGASRP